MNYVRSHWQGKSSLAFSFWVNLILLSIVLNALERFTFPPYIQNELAVTTAVIIFFVIVRLIIYPWQIVGTIRACDRYVATHTDRSWAIAAQAVVVMSIGATLIATFTTYQSLLGFKRSLHAPEPVVIEPQYSLDLVNRNTLVHLQGPFQIGITRALSGMLAKHPDVTGIILDSDGGQIYEGRGLARVIRENKLQTYSLSECTSACTTAFVAGVRRILGVNAKLGFHQYKTYAVLPNIDVAKEQAKDMALFEEQGVADEFLRKIFDKLPEEMWWPETDELVSAGVVHEIGFSFSFEERE